MPDCKKCGKHFPLKIMVDGKPRNLCKRKYCLECSPFGQHNTKILDDQTIMEKQQQKQPKEKTKCECGRCGREYIYDRSKGHTTNRCVSCYKKERAIRRKYKLVSMMGGRCNCCGYKKNYSALSFHHINPKIKLYSLDACTLGNRSWQNILEEAKKCVLLCMNCHQELHNPQHNIDKNQIDLSHIEKQFAEYNFCETCGKEIDKKATKCKECYSGGKEKITWPTTEELLKMLETQSFLAVGKILNVSDNAIRKRIKNHPVKIQS